MITPKELPQGNPVPLVLAWREAMQKANGHLIRWFQGGTAVGGIGEFNEVNITGAVLTKTDNRLTVAITGGGGGLVDADYGDITVSGTGTVMTIDNNSVTYAKFQDITTNKLLGRATAGLGDMEEITLGTNLSFTGTTLNASGGGGSPYTALTANVPAGVGQFEYEQTVTDATVTATSKIAIMLASTVDTDENGAETIELANMVAFPSAGSFILALSFRELTSGPIKLSYQVN